MTACYPVHAKEYEVRYAETIFIQEEIIDGAIFGTGDMKEMLKKMTHSTRIPYFSIWGS